MAQLERLGALFRQRRLEKGLSQEKFSSMLGLSRTRISAIERGVPGQSSILAEVADALGLDLVALPRESAEAAVARSRADAVRARRRHLSRGSE